MEQTHHALPANFGVRGKPGIRYLELKVNAGCSKRAAEFYKAQFGCGVAVDGAEANSAVAVGPNVNLLFTDADADPEADAAMVGVHIAIYITNYESVLNALHSLNVTWTNPRFAYLDRCDTVAEALRCRQFRFKDLQDQDGGGGGGGGDDSGGKICELEHETRSLTHAQFMKHVVYVSK